jgi:hypothetical protein
MDELEEKVGGAKAFVSFSGRAYVAVQVPA